MANRYANLPGSSNISVTYDQINQGFDLVEQDMDAEIEAREDLEARVDNLVNNPDPNKDLELVDARQPASGPAFATLKARLDDADAQRAAHLADITQRAINAMYPPAPLNRAAIDGVTDDTSVINAISSYLDSLGGGRLFIPAGTGACVINGTITMYDNIHIILAPNAVIDASGLDVSENLFEADGTVGDPVNLTVDATIGTTSITIAPGDDANFAEGDYVFICSNAIWEDSEPRAGEFQIVESVSSGIVELRDGVWDDYKVADSAFIKKLNPVKNIKISGGKILGGGMGANQTCCWFTYCDGITIESKIEGFENRSIQLVSCLNVKINADIIGGGIGGTATYGVHLRAGCQWVDVRGFFKNCRHAIEGGGSATEYGINRFVTFSGKVYGTLDAGISGKAANQYWTISGNTVSNAMSPSGSGDGIVFMGLDVIVANNTVINARRHAIHIQPMVANRGTTPVIAENVIKNPVGTGILLSPGRNSAQVAGAVIKGNVLTGGVDAIRVLTSTGLTGNTIKNFSIAGNTMTGFSGRGIWVRGLAEAIASGAISGNIVEAASGQTAIEIRSDGPVVERIAITGNRAYGGSYGIRGISQTNCFVDGNIAIGTTAGINGFAAGELGNNLTS